MRTASTIRLTLLSSLLGTIATTAATSVSALPDFSPATAAETTTELEPTLATSSQDGDLAFSTSQLMAQTTAPPAVAQSPTSVQIDQTKILAPQPGTTGEKSTNLVVQYPAGAKIRVMVNGKALDPAILTQTQPDPASNLVTQVWYNVPLQMGENTLTVQAESGELISTKLTVKETAARLLFLPTSNPRVAADGRSTVTVEGQIVDESGELIPQDALVTLSASAGKFVGADQDKDRPGFQIIARKGKFTAQLQSTLQAQKVRLRAAVDLREPKSVDLGKPPASAPPVQAEGNGSSSNGDIANPPLLNPAIAPGSPLQTTKDPYSLLSRTNELEAYTQVEFTVALRAPIVSGNLNLRIGGGGNDFYGSFRDFLNPDRLDNDFRVDFASAVFATGRVGDWLLTGAFNNQRPLNQLCDTNRLFRDPQFCDQVYPVYGDSSTVDYLAPSIDSIYFKAERTSPVVGAGSDFFMWGDYSTPEFSTASQYYTATNRQLHGFKANYNFGNLQLTAMYANNLQGFQRDTIAPNGTSGYYFVSRRLLVGGSEVVTVETEELNRPGTLVERKQMARGADYEIDYDRGTLLFRRPVLQTEFDLYGRVLARRIVVTYQYENTAIGDAALYAGRLQYNLSRDFGQESWLAATYLNEDQGGRTFELYGVDAWIALGSQGRLVAEYARSQNDSIFRGNIKGTAYRIEAYGPLFQGVFGRAYYRSIDENFANTATFSFTPGQTRYGAELAAKIGKTTQLQFQVDREENFGIASSFLGGFSNLFDPKPEPLPGSRVDNKLTTLRAGVVQKFGAAELSLDILNRSREDRVTNRLNDDSTQIVSRFGYPITKTLTFRAQNELNLSGTDPLYPNRTTVGLDWAVYPGVTVRLAQQFLSPTSQLRSNSITSLDTIVDQRLSEDTTMTGRYSLLNGVNGLTSQGALGLNHRITLAPGLRVNLGYERIFGDIFAYTAAGQQYAQPYAAGQSSASIGVTEGNNYSVGVEYTDNPNFKANGRLEYRDSRAGNSMVISAAAAGKISPSLTVLGRYQQANFANQLVSGLGDTINLKAGLAYRDPASDKLNVLLRYEFRQNPSTLPSDLLVSSGTGSTVHLGAIEAIYAPNWRWEFYGKFAIRSTKSYLAKDLVGTNAISLSQLRTSYRLGYRWDLVGEVRWISQSLIGFDEVGFVTEVGYYLTQNLRLSVGYSFGQARDRDFGDRTKSGPFINLNLKLNDLFGFGLQPVAPPQQQESKIQPVANQSTSAPPAAGQASAVSTIQPAPVVQPASTAQPVSSGQTAIGGQGQ